MKNFVMSVARKPGFVFWGKSISLSILDQGIFSGANFFLNILLARWLSPAIFGDFSVLFSFFLLISSVQNSISLEPMSVFGLSKHREGLDQYLDLLFITQLIVMSVIGALIIGFSLFVSDLVFKQALLGLGLGTPAILCLWYLRRAFYLKEKITLSIISNSIYAVIMLAGTAYLFQSALLNTMSAFLMMGIAGLVASIVAALLLKINLSRGFRLIFVSDSKLVFLETWGYCQWVLLTVLVNWISSLAIIPILKAFSGADQAAAYRSIQILYLPVQQILTAFQLFYLPLVSKVYADQGRKILHGMSRKVMFISLVSVSIYLLAVHIFGDEIIAIFYKSAFYSEYTWTLPYFSATILIGVVIQVLGINLRAINLPSSIFYSKAGATIIVLLVGIILVIRLDMMGAVIASLISSVTEAMIILFIYRKEFR